MEDIRRFALEMATRKYEADMSLTTAIAAAEHTKSMLFINARTTDEFLATAQAFVDWLEK